MRKIYFAFTLLLLLISFTGWSQIASDGLNNTATLFTASGGAFFTGNAAAGDGPASSAFATEGTHSYGISSGTATLTTADINTASYTAIGLSFKLASFSIGGTGNGADAGDIVTVEVSPNGGTNFYSTVRVLGPAASNGYWAYSATGNATAVYDGNATPVDFQPVGAGVHTTDGYSTVSVTGLPAVTNLVVRITLLNNATAERWVVDDFHVTGTLSCPAPAAPAATAGTLINSSGFTANWNAVAGATGYMLDVYTQAANTVAAEWTFPASGTTVTPSTNSANNAAKTITVNTGSGINNATGATTQAPSATSWNAGAGSKYWQVIIDATGFYNLTVSSKQYSSASGPRDFKLQYSTDGSTFTDVTVVPAIASGGWSGGTISNISLPAACDNQANLYVRWLMNSDEKADNSGTGVAAGSNSRIDDINIKGDGITFVPGYHNFSTTSLDEEIASLDASSIYYYVVRAVNACGSASVNSNEISVVTSVACDPSAVITSFAPGSGPAGTLVTITGTGFTGTAAVKFGSVAAASFTIVSDTKIIATTPAGAPADKVRVTVAACDAISALAFTPISQSAGCSNSSGYSSNIFISEVYDGEDGSLSYIEIFNGTAAAVNLATGNYVLRVITGPSNSIDIALSGTINSGAVFVLRLGDSDPNNGTGCGSIYGQTSALGGFNGNDQIYLGTLVGSTFTAVDYVPNPDYPGSANTGFSQVRKATAIAPDATTYTAGDWTVSTTEDCSNLGTAPYSFSGNTITVTTQPQDENDCSAIGFTVVATSSAPPPTYLWKYYNKITGTWDNASGITNATLGVAANNTTTATMTITGNTAPLFDYQFYCELGEGSCTLATDAVSYTYNTRPYYRNTSTGNWSNPAIWQMSNSATDWTAAAAACNYPTKENCSGVFIQSPFTVTQDLDINIDYLEIKSSAVLTTSLNSQLIVSDSTSGADFVIDGTWNYYANAANSFSADVITGTWKLGTNGTIVKTNDGSSTILRDYYEGTMSAIPAAANWFIRYTGADVTFTTTGGTYYPNLTFESNSGAWAPAAAASRFTGSAGYATVKGNLNIGGAGTGTVTVTNENTNAQPMLVNGNVSIVANNTLTTAGTANGTGFEIKGNVTVAGILTVISNNTGLLKLSAATGTQTVSGAGVINLQDVTAANTSSVILLNKDITIPGVLTSSDGSNLNLNTGNITLKSTAAATARLAPVNTGIIAYGTGQFIIERNVAALRSWRLLSIPVVTNQTMRQAWMEGAVPSTTGPLFNQDPVPNYGVHISGPSPAANGFDETPMNNYSVKYYTGTAWSGVGIQPDTSHLKYYPGWMLFVRGPRSYPIDITVVSTTPQTTTLRTKGQVYVGTQPVITPAGFTVVGNPYPSAVNFSSVTKAGAGDVYYIWDPRITSGSTSTTVGGWITLTRASGNTYTAAPAPITGAIDLTTGRIESGAAFVVNSTNITSLSFKETDKATQSSLVFRPQHNNGPAQQRSLRANLYVKNDDGTLAIFDGVLHLFDRSYSNKADGADALKFLGFAENICIASDDTLLAIEKRDLLSEKDTIYYRLKQLKFRNYTIELQPDKIFTGNLTGYFEDTYLNTSTPLAMQGATLVDFSITSAPGSYAAGRFRVVFRKALKFEEVKADCEEDDIEVSWKMKDGMEASDFEVERSADGVHFASVGNEAAAARTGRRSMYTWTDESPAPGLYYYRVKATGINGEEVLSDVVKANSVKRLHALYVSPNPVAGGNIHLQLTDKMPNGKYTAKLADGRGIVLLTKQFIQEGGNNVQIINAGKKLVPGIYQLQISGPGNTRFVLKVMFQ